MFLKFTFSSEDEKNEIIANSKDLYLIEVFYGIENNYLLFTDTLTDEIIVQDLQNKISILEAENETLKQELSITQDAVNELIFNSLNM